VLLLVMQGNLHEGEMGTLAVQCGSHAFSWASYTNAIVPQRDGRRRQGAVHCLVCSTPPVAPQALPSSASDYPTKAGASANGPCWMSAMSPCNLACIRTHAGSAAHQTRLKNYEATAASLDLASPPSLAGAAYNFSAHPRWEPPAPVLTPQALRLLQQPRAPPAARLQ
jgi:hypothetical protein